MDEVVEVAEEVLNAELKTLLKGVTIGSVVWAGIGVAACFVIHKKLDSKYAKLAEVEIAEAKEFYQRLYKADEFATPGGAVDSLADDAANATRRYQGRASEEAAPDGDESLVVEETRVEIEEKNIFQDRLTEDGWDQEKEEEFRATIDNGVPFIIHHDEYMEGEKNYRQVTLTYFLGDDILVDDQDKPIEEVDKTVGVENVTRFGHGSKDNRIVYIRNDRLSLDFEVVSDENSYTEKVLGLQHSYEPGARKFRDTDD